MFLFVDLRDTFFRFRVGGDRKKSSENGQLTSEITWFGKQIKKKQKSRWLPYWFLCCDIISSQSDKQLREESKLSAWNFERRILTLKAPRKKRI